MPVDESISSVVLLIGLAVGVDYCMFYLRREMEERDAGRAPDAALNAAAATSGRAVLISGITVMVAMGGMFLAGNAVFESFAVGTILVVAVAIVGSLTVLPAMLSFLGQKGWTEKGRVPYVAKLRHRTKGESRVWGAVIDRVLKRPVLSIVLSGGLLVALAIPALEHAHDQPRRRRPAAQPADRADLRPPPGRLPRRRRAGRHRARGEGRHGAGRHGRDRRAQARGEDDAGPRPADHGHEQPRQDGRDRRGPAGGRRHRRRLGGRPGAPARRRHPGNARSASRLAGATSPA